MTNDMLKEILREVFDFAEEQLKARPLLRAALEAAEHILLDTPLWDVLFARLARKGLVPS